MNHSVFKFPRLDTTEHFYVPHGVKPISDSATYVQRPLFSSPGFFSSRNNAHSSIAEEAPSPGPTLPLHLLENTLPSYSEDVLQYSHEHGIHECHWYQKSDPWTSYMHTLPVSTVGGLLPPFQETPSNFLPNAPPAPPAPPLPYASQCQRPTRYPVLPSKPPFIIVPPVSFPEPVHGWHTNIPSPSSRLMASRESSFTDQFFSLGSSPRADVPPRPAFDPNQPETAPPSSVEPEIIHEEREVTPVCKDPSLDGVDSADNPVKADLAAVTSTPPSSKGSKRSDTDWVAENSPPDRSPKKWRQRAAVAAARKAARAAAKDGANEETLLASDLNQAEFELRIATYLRDRRHRLKRTDIPPPRIYQASQPSRRQMLDAMTPLTEAESRGYKRCGGTFCKERFKSVEKFADHLDACHPRMHRKYLCPVKNCVWSAIGFKCCASYSRHWREVHGPPLFECIYPGCDKVFKRSDNCLRHSRTEHLAVSRKNETSDKEWAPVERARQSQSKDSTGASETVSRGTETTEPAGAKVPPKSKKAARATNPARTKKPVRAKATDRANAPDPEAAEAEAAEAAEACSDAKVEVESKS